MKHGFIEEMIKTGNKGSAHDFVKAKGSNLQSAILLIGPTGSGKTPLGDYLEKHGFFGIRCVHFDFGANLRGIARKRIRPLCLSASDFDIIKQLIKSGGLLVERDLHIAKCILEEFIRFNKIKGNDILVLNGLPRHEGQAVAVGAIVDIKLVVSLCCKAGMVLARIRKNSGGDREGRIDDSKTLIAHKMRIFRTRTLRLVDYYRGKGVKVISINVTEGSTPAAILSVIDKYKMCFRD
ncbi:MAG: nucleoside monophosphate kinase [Kiritimatiellae bacterium]|nr:nucleoside monophosphate kinase [Kiritimatiellia bacterium]MDD5520745.1 nucleoside monophosphate kinase [Kiritimatiellia bacterium]